MKSIAAIFALTVVSAASSTIMLSVNVRLIGAKNGRLLTGFHAKHP